MSENKFCEFIDNKKCEYRKKNESEIGLTCVFCILKLIEGHIYAIKKVAEKSGNTKKKY